MLCGEVRRALLFANRCGTMPDLSAFGHFDEVQFENAVVRIVFVHCCFDVDVLSFAHEGGNADRTVVEIAPSDSFESETWSINAFRAVITCVYQRIVKQVTWMLIVGYNACNVAVEFNSASLVFFGECGQRTNRKDLSLQAEQRIPDCWQR